MFFSPTDLAAALTSMLKSLTRNAQYLSGHKGCGNGSMIVFTPDGKGQLVNDKKCIEQVKQIMVSTPGFDNVYDRRKYVLWTSMMESMSTMRGDSLNTILESFFLAFAQSVGNRL